MPSEERERARTADDMQLKGGRVAGWEVAAKLEGEKPTMYQRLIPGKKELIATFVGLTVFTLVFIFGWWLANNPFETTQRIASPFVEARGWAGTNEWAIIWSVVLIAMVLEYLDAAAGMGYGTAITPLLLVMGFSPLQVVPAVMIQQCAAGLVGAYLHSEYKNVVWQVKPMSETVKLAIIISSIGSLAIMFSITAVYAIFEIAETWIRLYVVMLLLMMGVIALIKVRPGRPYKPYHMLAWGAIAGFNKGVGGGGYGPVVTIGGLLSGIPVKSMLAVTAICEGTVCLTAIVVWFTLLRVGVVIDYLLLPSMMLATIVTAVAAPYTVRIAPTKIWTYVVPAYCVILAVFSFQQMMPRIIRELG